jgi:hypothetical protein
MAVTRLKLSGLAALVLLMVAGWVFLSESSPPNHTIKLVFDAEAGDQPFVLNKFAYNNPGGEGTFQIRDFRFYLSNFKLTGNESTFSEYDSYHLARFDNAENVYSINLENVPLEDLSMVSFSIGVDDKANRSIEPRGDLDPNSQMAWNWEVGYKFVLFEGRIRLDDQMHPLVYHVGFGENVRNLEFELPQEIELHDFQKIHFRVDVMKLFSGVSNINMATLNAVKFDKNDARTLANNYQNMIELKTR